MMKKIIFSITLVLYSQQALATNYFEQYSKIKNNIEEKYSMSFGVDTRFTLQNIASNTIQNSLITPYLNKEIFNNKYGKANFNFSMNFVRFSPLTPIELSIKEGNITLFNSYDDEYNELYELYFIYTLPNKYNWINLGLGQVPVSKFDSPIASDLQRLYFLNSSLAQNTTFTYPTAGVGGYVELNLNKYLDVALGSIDAANPLAKGLRVDNLKQDQYSKFALINYKPIYKNKYQGSYSLLFYDKPYVNKAPYSSQGWSLYVAQDITTKHSLFFRLNQTTSDYSAIKRSYALGVLVDNPLKRHYKDQFGFGYSVNKLNNKSIENRNNDKYEHIIESYYDYNLNNNISIRPDVQLYLNKGSNIDNKMMGVFSISIQLSL